MTPRTRLMLMTAVLALTGSVAMAAVTTEELIERYSSQGYSRIEVKRGGGRIAVEAVRGSEKIEVVIDAETGAVLKQETTDASAGEQGGSGVEKSTKGGNVVDGSDGDDGDDDGDGSGDGDDDHGSDHDDGDDNDDHGSDHDDGDDDHGSDHDDDDGDHDDGDDDNGDDDDDN